MKTADDRAAMVARVQTFADKYPSLKAVPEAAGPINATVEAPRDQAAYIRALYEVAAKGEPVGRSKDGGTLFGAAIKKGNAK